MATWCGPTVSLWYQECLSVDIAIYEDVLNLVPQPPVKQPKYLIPSIAYFTFLGVWVAADLTRWLAVACLVVTICLWAVLGCLVHLSGRSAYNGFPVASQLPITLLSPIAVEDPAWQEYLRDACRQRMTRLVALTHLAELVPTDLANAVCGYCGPSETPATPAFDGKFMAQIGHLYKGPGVPGALRAFPAIVSLFRRA